MAVGGAWSPAGGAGGGCRGVAQKYRLFFLFASTGISGIYVLCRSEEQGAGQRGKGSMSNEPYKAQEIEQKWRQRWEARGMHRVTEADRTAPILLPGHVSLSLGVRAARGALARLCPLGRLEPL